LRTITLNPLMLALGLLFANPSPAVDTTLFDMPAQNKPKSSLGNSFDVPTLGATPGLIERQHEEKLAEMVLRQLGKEVPLVEDAWVKDELMKVFSKIYSNASIGSPVAMVVINDNSINAFAVPGGLFALNSGLILSARTVDEVAGVMGHEIAHVSQRHYSRGRDAMKHQGLLSLAGLLTSILIASQSPDAASAVALGTQAALIDRQLSYSRNQEREADRVGMHLMNAAGYNPMAMADFFEVMNRKTGSIGFLPDFWLTHPLSTERMSEARLRATQFPKINRQLVLADEENFRMIQLRLAVLTHQMSETRLKSYAANDQAAALALATFYGQEGKFQQARELAQRIIKAQPNSSIAAITMAEIELQANNPEQAVAILLPKYRIMPESRALALALANAYITQDKPIEALDLLNPLATRYKRDTQVWQSMEAAANRLPDSQNKAVNVLRYRAEILFWRGDVDNAIRSLLRASKLAQQNYSLQAHIERRLEEMQEDRQFKA
jgi:predicted Zn-dependent protease